ncbi:hypothetical protein BKA66DRAFT_460142 [Pyrenochaeta sp. MPI-SDFR-AT-0127]|nr:hypothetical protein BKA66DRAFT_460142 [Pyrenochaeta sp. MPI-SDFR-AT-0127]
MASNLGWKMPSEELLLSFFTYDIAKDIGTSNFSPQVTRFEKVILHFAQERTGVHLKSAFPTDLNNFFIVLGSILSAGMKNVFRQNLRSFDATAGWDVADDFICSCTFEYWLKFLADSLIRVSKFQTSRSAASSSQPSGGFSTNTTLSSRTTYSPTTLDKNYDGTFDEPSLAYPSANSGGGTSGKIVQVKLEGPTIRQAWAMNATLVDARYGATLSKLEEWSPDSKYVPKEPGAYSVYHGTAAHFGLSAWPDRWNEPKLDLSPSVAPNQMSPGGIGVVYTAFSPLRAFLWAAFQEHMYANTPAPKGMSWLSTSWTSAGQTFTGVAVFSFDVVQPKPSTPPMSACIVPQGKERAWHEKAIQMSEGLSWHNNLEQAWQNMSPLHGSTDIKSWPEVLHSMEFGEQRAFLTPFKTNMWRTCWSGQGVDALNSAYRNTMAITFVKSTPPPQLKTSAPLQTPPKNDDNGDEGKGKSRGKDRLKTLTKKMSQALSGKSKGKVKN